MQVGTSSTTPSAWLVDESRSTQSDQPTTTLLEDALSDGGLPVYGKMIKSAAASLHSVTHYHSELQLPTNSGVIHEQAPPVTLHFVDESFFDYTAETENKRCSTCKTVKSLDSFSHSKATCNTCRVTQIQPKVDPPQAVASKTCSTCRRFLPAESFNAGRCTCFECSERKKLRKARTKLERVANTKNGDSQYCSSCRKSKSKSDFSENKLQCTACRKRKYTKRTPVKTTTEGQPQAPACANKRLREAEMELLMETLVTEDMSGTISTSKPSVAL